MISQYLLFLTFVFHLPAFHQAFVHPALPLDRTTVVAFFPTDHHQHQQTVVQTFGNALFPLVTQEPGFESCCVYTSRDGTAVALLEHWASLEQCRQSYSEDSMPTAVRKSLKFVLGVDDALVDRDVYHVCETVSEKPTAQDNVVIVFDAETDLQQPVEGRAFGAVYQNIEGTRTLPYSQWFGNYVGERQEGVYELAAYHTPAWN